MKYDQSRDVDVADAIPIRKAEILFSEIVLHAAQATSCVGGFASIYQRHAPWLGACLMNFHLVVRHVEGDIRHVQEVIGEVLLDHVAAIAQADDEILDAVRKIDLHDVPKNRLAADLHHRLWPRNGFFSEAGAHAPGEYHGFHGSSSNLHS